MREEYKKRLAEGLHVNSPGARGRSRVLGFNRPDSRSTSDDFENSPLLSSRSECATPTRPAKSLLRNIPSAPERILDAPDLLDDYYLNLLHWGSNNVVAVALGPCVFLWNASDGGITKLMEVEEEEEYVTSVQWAADGKHVAVGTSGAEVKIWDATAQRAVRTLEGHHARVSALAWNANILSSGGRDSIIINHDIRSVAPL
jgi:cell division cycle protein 20 (cofactor of APC complex)